MSTDATPILQPLEDWPDWVPAPPPTDLIFDDGEPLESARHRLAMNTLIRSAKQFLLPQRSCFIGGNMFVYHSTRQVKNRDFRGPDFLVVLDVDSDPTRKGWVVWEEGGRYPDVIVEFLSDSTAEADLGPKKDLYEQVYKARDYFVYDPFDPTSFQGWSLNNQLRYQQLTPNAQGRLWSDALGLWLGLWEGAVEDDRTIWLRFFDADGNLVLLPEEQAEQEAEQERQRAEQAEQQLAELMVRLRERGIDPNTL